MVLGIIGIGVLYLLACGLAWALHEAAHFLVHRVHAESASVGVNRRGPYVDAVYADHAPSSAIRLGSIAPTLIFAPIVVAAGFLYLRLFQVPTFDLVEWSLVLTPIAILVTPTGADLRAFIDG